MSRYCKQHRQYGLCRFCFPANPEPKAAGTAEDPIFQPLPTPPPEPAPRAHTPKTTMNDDTPMPFGKYRGTRLGDVPADYLLFLWDKDDGLWNDKGGLSDYIRINFSALETDAPDKIIKHRPQKGA